MEALTSHVQPFLVWLWQTTLVTSLLIGLILIVQSLLGRRLGPRWCHALWLVLLVRMVLPWAPASPISLFSLIPATIPLAEREDSRHVPADKDRPLPTAAAEADQARTAAESTPPDATAIAGIPGPEKQIDTPLPAKAVIPTLHHALPALWLAGAMVLGAYLLASNFALWRIIKRDHPLTNQPILELFEQCKSQMGVQTIVALVPNEQVRSAALFGFLRPRLLLPQRMIETATHRELRYVFLHELAHLKRGDIYLGWLTSLLQVLHWFNPFIWLAFHRMRTDRELACDALVLTRTGGDESYEYGRTMVGLLNRFSRARHLPALAGILESRSQLKRRIAMIARFQAKSYRWSPAAVVTILAVACLALPGAGRDSAAGNGATHRMAEPSRRPAFHKVQIPNEIPWDAQLSPDGKSIAMVLEGKLWIVPRSGKLGPDYPGASALLPTGAHKPEWAGLAWSRDGRWIAFNDSEVIQAQGRKGNQKIYVVPVEGGTPKEVCENYRDARIVNYRMSLSPHGKTLAFSSVDANTLHIYTIPVHGGRPKRLVEAPAREPVFSPDGRWVAYVEDKLLGRLGGGLWVVPAEGGTPALVAPAANASSPVWSPDGRWIAFLDEEQPKAYLVPVDDKGAPAGAKIAFDGPDGFDEICRLTGWTSDNKIGVIFSTRREFGLYTLAVNDGRATLIANKGWPQQPRWSPDGKQVIYSKYVKEGREGWVDFDLASVPADGGEGKTIPNRSGTKLVHPAWGCGNHVSPDGKTILFAGRTLQEGVYIMHLWTLPIEGGIPRQLTNAAAPLSDWYPCWSPDGKTIAFVRIRVSPNYTDEFQTPTIYLLPAAGGEPRPLTRESDRVEFGSIAWSPDGKLLAYLSRDEGGSLKVIPAEGGDSRIVGKLQATHVNVDLAWSPDSRRIAFNDRDDKTIKIMSLNEGTTASIQPHLAQATIYHLDWSRDGERLVFVAVRGGDRELWMMEDFLPQEAGK